MTKKKGNTFLGRKEEKCPYVGVNINERKIQQTDTCERTQKKK